MRLMLKQLNFSEKEIDIYLAALKMGKGLISQLAKKAGVKRPTAYVILEKLKEKGLVSLSEKKNKQIFVAENPEKLLKMLERQKEGLLEKEEEIKKSLPELKSLAKKNVGLPLFKHYEGKEGVWNILDDLTESGVSEAWIIFPDRLFDVFGATFINNLFLKRRQKGIKIYAIHDKHPESLKLYDEWKEKKDTYFREYKLMPQDIELNNVVYLYGNKLALIFLKEEEPSGLIIESEELFKVFKFMFDSLWTNL